MRTLGWVLLGCILAPIGAACLLYRECQWQHRYGPRFRGHYDPPVEPWRGA